MKTICRVPISTIIFFGFFLTLTNSCNKEVLKSISVLTTNEVISVTATTAKSGGNITFDGNSAIKSCGVCWSLNPNPTILDERTIDTATKGIFTSSMTSLIAETTYYIRAYATNEEGTAYGNQLTFKTLQKTLSVLQTTLPNNITENSATCGGSVTSDGNSTILSRGICWSTKANPTTSDNKISVGSGIGTFSTGLTGLSIGTTYYVRAYATNSIGTSYGNEQHFATKGPTVTDVDGNIYHSVTLGSQTWLVENLRTSKYRDGSSIPNVSDNSTWINLTSGAWCTYNNDEANGIKYGKLYNWYAATDSRNIAPLGWHVATYEEWSILGKYVNDNLGTSKFVSKALAATTDWTYNGSSCIGNSIYANNSTGFTALPSGALLTSETYDYGIYKHGAFLNLGVDFWCWTITEKAQYTLDDPAKAVCFILDNLEPGLGYSGVYKTSGFAIRCLKD